MGWICRLPFANIKGILAFVNICELSVILNLKGRENKLSEFELSHYTEKHRRRSQYARYATGVHI